MLVLLDGVLLGILSNDDGDGNDNGNEKVKKTIGLWSKTTILHMYHAFLPSLHDYDVKCLITRFMEDVNKGCYFFFLFLNLIAVHKKSTPGKYSFTDFFSELE